MNADGLNLRIQYCQILQVNLASLQTLLHDAKLLSFKQLSKHQAAELAAGLSNAVHIRIRHLTFGTGHRQGGSRDRNQVDAWTTMTDLVLT